MQMSSFGLESLFLVEYSLQISLLALKSRDSTMETSVRPVNDNRGKDDIE